MQITPHLHMLTIPFNVPLPTGPVPRSVNCFIVAGTRIALIDSGVADAEEQIFAYLNGIGRSPEEIDTLILTHSHPDHIGAAQPIRNQTGCRILAHSAEREWIEDVAVQARQRPVPGFTSLVAGSVPVDGLLEAGMRLELGDGCTLEILHTPGHSAGSISLWQPETGILITGDAVPVPGDLPILESLEDSLRSLEQLRGCDARMLLSSWDRPQLQADVRKALEAGRDWLHRVKQTVREEQGEANPDPMELCRRVVPRLGLPPQALNPLVARSLAACLGELAA